MPSSESRKKGLRRKREALFERLTYRRVLVSCRAFMSSGIICPSPTGGTTPEIGYIQIVITMKRKPVKKLSRSIRKPVPMPTKVERDRRADIEREEAEREIAEERKRRSRK